MSEVSVPDPLMQQCREAVPRTASRDPRDARWERGGSLPAGVKVLAVLNEVHCLGSMGRQPGGPVESDLPREKLEGIVPKKQINPTATAMASIASGATADVADTGEQNFSEAGKLREGLVEVTSEEGGHGPLALGVQQASSEGGSGAEVVHLGPPGITIEVVQVDSGEVPNLPAASHSPIPEVLLKGGINTLPD